MVVLLQLTSRAQSLVVVDGLTLPDESSYGYHDQWRGASAARYYVLQEQRPRTYLMCPRGSAIEKASVVIRNTTFPLGTYTQAVSKNSLYCMQHSKKNRLTTHVFSNWSGSSKAIFTHLIWSDPARRAGHNKLANQRAGRRQPECVVRFDWRTYVIGRSGVDQAVVT